MTLSLFLYGLLSITVVNCIYYLIFSKFSFSKSVVPQNDYQTPVSVLIYTKNEAVLIPDFLKQFKNQTHQNFELILINNASSDNTRDIFEEYQKEHSNVAIVNVENNEAFWGSRKYALTLGIKKATHEKLLFTTPQATIKNSDWIAASTSLLNTEKQIVVGYCAIKKTTSLFNLFSRFIELFRTLKNLGIGSITKPYAGSQSNFAYNKSLFLENNAFSNHMSIHDGAEDLFLKQNATSKNTVITTTESTTIEKSPLNSFSEWFNYKVKQSKIIKKLNSTTQLGIHVFEVSQVLFFITAIISLIAIPSPLTYGIVAIRYLITGSTLIATAYKLRDPKAVLLFPIMEIFYCFIQFPIFMRSLSSK